MRLLVTRPDGTKEEVEVSLPITFEEVPKKNIGPLPDSWYQDSQSAADNIDRLSLAAEGIAQALTNIATLMAKRLEKDFPAKREPSDATITRVPDADDALRRKQGASDETTEEWIGLREQEFVDSGKKS